MRRLPVIGVLVLLMGTASADGVSATYDPRETSRLMVAAGAGMYASYPGSLEDPAPFVAIAKPLWLGERHRFAQLVVDANATVGYGTASQHAHLALGATTGVNLYLGSVIGIEFRFGFAGLAQLGRDTVGGAGFTGGGGYVFRLWDDDRKRLKLWMAMTAGVVFAEDPMNDAPGSHLLGIGVGYEAPL